ncbi:MAG: methyl-accepting chemotaxis protein [Deltaproteobacteria bacterium]|nr:methyl-accepting chemotaxis protein [Deltaproteobacteria bacterium]
MNIGRLGKKIFLVNGLIVLGAVALHFFALWTKNLAGIETWMSALMFILGITALMLGVTYPYLRALTQNLQLLNDATSRISKGDLSTLVKFDSPSRFPDEVDSLAENINHMLDNLRELVAHLQKTAGHIASSANTLSSAAERSSSVNTEVTTSVGNIARSADLQNELVGKASGLMTDIAAGIEKSSSAADAASRAVAETHTAARTGTEVANLAVEKLHQVFERVEVSSERVFAFGEKSKAIGKIVDVITQISQRTNLLALNATIEAARAGEAGRGFAVVADEVRKLAESAGSSADQITDLLSDLREDSEQAVASMSESTRDLDLSREDLSSIIQSLDGIVVAALRGAEKAEQIARSSTGQMQGSQEMVMAITHISDLARQSVVSTDEVATSSNEQTTVMERLSSSALELSNISLELEDVIQRFDLKGEEKGA